VLLVLLAAHRHFGLSQRVLVMCAVLLLGGLIASHSRGAMVALGAGTLIWFFREARRASPKLRVAAIVAAVGIAIFAGTSVWNELHQAPGTHSSLTVRSAVEKETRALWIHHPWTGVGLRFFKTPRYAGYQAPNNVFDEIAAEAGILGIFGFAVFVIGSLVGLGRLRGDLATAGLCAVAARFTHGLFDIYWTGGTTTLPWIIAGMGLASATLRRPGEATA
jgi:O-antigen ligase